VRPSGGENELPVRSAALLLALTAALLLLRLGDVPLIGPDEPRYARVAVEMRRSGDLVTPTLQGRPWLEKPPLYYWLAGVAFSLFGETEAAARLPSVAACLLLVASTAAVGARLHGGAAGLHAGFILGTSVLPFAYGRAASMDMLLASALTAGFGLLALHLVGAGGALLAPAAAACFGLATLAKGPLGLLLPAMVVAVYVLVTREWRLLRSLVTPAALASFLVVAAPWYLLVYRAQGQAFVDVFLLDHNLQRFTSTIHHHPGPLYYYVPVLLPGLFPWSGLALPALGALEPRRSRGDLFLLLWLGVPFAFFSAAGSKLPGYILPCLPPLALLMGRAAAELIGGRSFPAGTGPRAVSLVGLALGALVASGPLVLRTQGEPRWSDALPPALWALIVTFTIARRIDRSPAGALALLRVGAAGFLLLLTSALPPLIARRESGRDLFLPARGREVLAWGAWRTAWMAGYFYNDGKVREVRGEGEIEQALSGGPILVLCGPSERRRLEKRPELATLALVEGPRRNVLLRVERRQDLIASSPSGRASLPWAGRNR
jgi:4-amino-4-deoxy-L-arabinose transferase-like glycosyltransferase